ncbi:hypothetical protein, partial [Salmonella sp. s54412]|uniref:hypothetical protein n=2 Tax=unclassified Salmonella TaxID=2614656 RepID=UPI0037542F23
FHVKGEKKNVKISEIPPYRDALEEGDVFIIDTGLLIYQWNGCRCNKDEKFKAVQYLQTIKAQRSGKPNVESLDEREISNDHKVYHLLKSGSSGENKENEDDSDSFPETLLKLSDEGGVMKMTTVSEGSIPKDMLDSKDVFIADTGKELFVWIGKRASKVEKKNGLKYAHNYLKNTKHPLISVTVLKEGQRNDAFEKILD